MQSWASLSSLNGDFIGQCYPLETRLSSRYFVYQVHSQMYLIYQILFNLRPPSQRWREFSMNSHFIHMSFYEYLWISLNFYEVLWISMNSYEFVKFLFSMNFLEIPRISMNPHFLWISISYEFSMHFRSISGTEHVNCDLIESSDSIEIHDSKDFIVVHSDDLVEMPSTDFVYDFHWRFIKIVWNVIEFQLSEFKTNVIANNWSLKSTYDDALLLSLSH